MSEHIHQGVTNRILKALADGLVPWGRPWLGHRNDGPPTNALTSFPFRGVNPLLLNLIGFRSKWWATAKVWKDFGFCTKPHQKGTQIFTGKASDLQRQTVFNAEQVEGPGGERYLVLEPTGTRPPNYESADRMIAATGADIRHVYGTEAAYYRLPNDYIVLPLKIQFEIGPGGLPGYYNTVLHETTHWSEHRLGWLADPHLGQQDRYDIGELRATLGATFLSAEIGIPFYHNETSHRMYVESWKKLMKADPTLIIRVAEAAWDATRFILSFSRKQSAVFPNDKAISLAHAPWSSP